MSALPLTRPESGSDAHAGSAAAAVLRQPMLWLLVALLAAGALSSPYFLSADNMANLLRQVAVFGLLALGMNLVMLTGRIDLSVGATMVFSVIAAVEIMVVAGGMLDVRMMGRGNTYVGPVAPVAALTLAVGALVGLFNGLGVACGRVAPFIMTLVTLSALRGLSYVLSNGRPYYLRSDAYRWLGEARVGPVPVAALVLLAVFVVFAWLLHAHLAGKRIYAIGGDEKTARFAGVRVGRWLVAVYVASGLCAALAGLILTSRANSVDAPMATGYELSAIAIAVLGGTSLMGGHGSPWRTLCAAFVFAAGLNLLTLHDVSAWYQDLIIGVVLIAAVAAASAMQRRGA
ncbi:ABC transporter permease [Xenophilus azovorans]|uniref:ABC transporter permease n=1 Tax=Xenophilus azovorans TaxID=151755 RepID=UPI00068DDC4E|nr:ABC transporter permease [Xenophilus azovorans]